MLQNSSGKIWIFCWIKWWFDLFLPTARKIVNLFEFCDFCWKFYWVGILWQKFDLEKKINFFVESTDISYLWLEKLSIFINLMIFVRNSISKTYEKIRNEKKLFFFLNLVMFLYLLPMARKDVNFYQFSNFFFKIIIQRGRYCDKIQAEKKLNFLLNQVMFWPILPRKSSYFFSILWFLFKIIFRCDKIWPEKKTEFFCWIQRCFDIFYFRCYKNVSDRKVVNFYQFTDFFVNHNPKGGKYKLKNIIFL